MVKISLCWKLFPLFNRIREQRLYEGVILITIDMMVEGFSPVLHVVAVVLLWVAVPGLFVYKLLDRMKYSYQIGAFIGLTALIKVGPWS